MGRDQMRRQGAAFICHDRRLHANRADDLRKHGEARATIVAGDQGVAERVAFKPKGEQEKVFRCNTFLPTRLGRTRREGIVDREDDIDPGVHCQGVVGDLAGRLWCGAGIERKHKTGMGKDAPEPSQESLAAVTRIGQFESQVKQLGATVQMIAHPLSRPTPERKAGRPVVDGNERDRTGHRD